MKYIHVFLLIIATTAVSAYHESGHDNDDSIDLYELDDGYLDTDNARVRDDFDVEPGKSKAYLPLARRGLRSFLSGRPPRLPSRSKLSKAWEKQKKQIQDDHLSRPWKQRKSAVQTPQEWQAMLKDLKTKRMEFYKKHDPKDILGEHYE